MAYVWTCMRNFLSGPSYVNVYLIVSNYNRLYVLFLYLATSLSWSFWCCSFIPTSRFISLYEFWITHFPISLNWFLFPGKYTISVALVFHSSNEWIIRWIDSMASGGWGRSENMYNPNVCIKLNMLLNITNWI